MIQALIRDLRTVGSHGGLYQLKRALVQANYQGAAPGQVDWLYADGVRELINQGRVDDARAKLASIAGPEQLLKMLGDRRYEPVWPDLEQWVGQNGRSAIDHYIVETRRAYEREPNNLVRLMYYMRALRTAGRPEEAMAIGAEISLSKTDVMRHGEDLIWAVNEHAFALGDSGRIAEADERFAQVNAVGIRRQPELINTIINRVLFLLGSGRSDQALDAAEIAEKVGPPKQVHLARCLYGPPRLVHSTGLADRRTSSRFSESWTRQERSKARLFFTQCSVLTDLMMPRAW